jgi:hypothetical protein
MSHYNNGPRNDAQHMHDQTRLPLTVCSQLISASKRGDKRLLAILAEKYLLNGQQSETLKENGLTVFDCIDGEHFGTRSVEVAEAVLGDWNDYLSADIFPIPVGA